MLRLRSRIAFEVFTAVIILRVHHKDANTCLSSVSTLDLNPHNRSVDHYNNNEIGKLQLSLDHVYLHIYPHCANKHFFIPALSQTPSLIDQVFSYTCV